MSAWIVSKAHVDCLVQAMITEGIVPMEIASQVGLELWTENHKSIEARYGDPVPELEYEFEGVEAPLDPEIVLKQVHCFDYQTCEHHEWQSTASFARVETLGETLRTKMGVEFDFYPHRGPWGISRLEEAILVPA